MQGRRVSPALAATVLALVALTGLMAGVLTTPTQGQSRTPGAQAGAGTGTTSVAAPSVTVTSSAPTLTRAGNFTVRITFEPPTVAPGQTLTVRARVESGGAGVGPVECTVGADPGTASLLATWPGTAYTASDGTVAWTLTVPSDASGAYRVRVAARSATYSAERISTVNVTPGGQ